MKRHRAIQEDKSGVRGQTRRYRTTQGKSRGRGEITGRLKRTYKEEDAKCRERG